MNILRPLKILPDTLVDRAAGLRKGISFVALAGALRRGYDARVSYLQSANQFVANHVALEQAIGAPLGQ